MAVVIKPQYHTPGTHFNSQYSNNIETPIKIPEQLMKITSALTEEETIQELEWRSTNNTGLSHEEILALPIIFTKALRVNPSGYGLKDSERLQDTIEVTAHILHQLWKRISNKHAFTHQSIIKVIKYLAEELERGDIPSSDYPNLTLQKQEDVTYTIEDVEAAAVKGYEEGYRQATEDTKIVQKNYRPPFNPLTE